MAKITVPKTTIPHIPKEGTQTLFIDEVDGLVKKIDDQGNVITLEGGGGGGSTLIEKTYSELTTMMSNSELEPGQLYLMTDFQTIYDQPDYSNATTRKTTVVTKTASVDPIILLAISETEFAKEVWRPSTPKHKLEYDISFNQTEVMGAPAKGRITKCIDEFNNETHYDHTVILLKRYESVSGLGIFNSFWDTGFGSTEVLTFGAGSVSNKIGDNYYELKGGFAVSNNVLGANSVGNSIGIVSINNTFGNNIGGNTFGSNTQNNTFGNTTNGNTFGDDTQYNTFGDDIQGIDFTITPTPTHIYANYPCNIFKRQDGTVRLSYYDDTDTLVVANPTD